MNAYLTSNNAYTALVIPATQQAIINPSPEILSDCTSFIDWSGDYDWQGMLENTDNLSETEIAELFGDVIQVFQDA